LSNSKFIDIVIVSGLNDGAIAFFYEFAIAFLKIQKRAFMVEKKKCGFAVMSEEKRREISSKGGKASQSSGRAHKFTKEECSEGGKSISQDKERMAEIGRKGGKGKQEKEVQEQGF
jgi:general stress protein YciG